jgi:hypothetical protein
MICCPPPLLQTPMPTCCQNAPHGGDYWCASPSAAAVTALFAEVLVGTNTDYSVPNLEDSTKGNNRLLVERIWQLETRAKQVCSRVSAWAEGSGGEARYLSCQGGRDR